MPIEPTYLNKPLWDRGFVQCQTDSGYASVSDAALGRPMPHGLRMEHRIRELCAIILCLIHQTKQPRRPSGEGAD